jgi:hypothetical protein
VVESQPSKLLVAGSIPVSRSIARLRSFEVHIPDANGQAVGNFEQPVLAIADPGRFQTVHAAIEEAFSSAKVAGFMQSLSRRGMRIRNFEAVLSNGLLGKTAGAEYNQLGNADQGQIREFYLASLEKVAPDVREKFFKLYAYYY